MGNDLLLKELQEIILEFHFENSDLELFYDRIIQLGERHEKINGWIHLMECNT